MWCIDADLRVSMAQMLFRACAFDPDPANRSTGSVPDVDQDQAIVAGLRGASLRC